MMGPLRLQETIATVGGALGLGEAEAAIYVHLCVTGPAKAGDLARALDIHRNEVYRSASRLVERGVVETTLERPSRYAAVDPTAVFETQIASRLASVEALKHARDRVSPLLAQMQVGASAPAKSTYKVVQGRAEVLALRDRLVGTAQRSLDWATTFGASLQFTDLASGVELLHRRVAEDGIALRALVRTNDAGWRRLAALETLPRARVRELDLERTVRFVIVDGTDLLMWVVNDPSDAPHAKDEVAIHTTAPGFVQAESVFFEQTWSRARTRTPTDPTTLPALGGNTRA